MQSYYNVIHFLINKASVQIFRALFGDIHFWIVVISGLQANKYLLDLFFLLLILAGLYYLFIGFNSPPVNFLLVLVVFGLLYSNLIYFSFQTFLLDQVMYLIKSYLSFATTTTTTKNLTQCLWFIKFVSFLFAKSTTTQQQAIPITNKTK